MKVLLVGDRGPGGRGLARKRVGAWVTAAVLLMMVPVGLSAVDPSSFVGNFRLGGRIATTSSTLELASAFPLDVSPAPGNGLLLSGKSLVLDIMEITRANRPSSPDEAPTVAERQLTLADARVRLTSLSENATWRGLGARSPSIQLGVGSKCMVDAQQDAEARPSSPEGSAINGGLAGPDAPQPTEEGQGPVLPTLEVECWLEEFETRDLAQMVVFDTAVLIESAAQRESLNVSLLSGLVEADSSSAGTITTTIITLRAADGDRLGSRPAEDWRTQRIHFRVAGLTIVGRLDIPGAHGDVRWGDWSDHGILSPMHPQGVFVLTPKEDSGLHVQGQALGAAPTTAGLPRAEAHPVWLVATALPILLFEVVRRLRPLAVLLFTRLVKDEILDNPLRRRVLQMVREAPGSGLRELARRLRVSRSAVSHHVRVLHLAKLVRVGGGAQRARVFPYGFDQQALLRNEALDDAANQLILRALLANPNASQQELSAAAGVSQPVVSRRLRRLAHLGILQRTGPRLRSRFVVTVALTSHDGVPVAS